MSISLQQKQFLNTMQTDHKPKSLGLIERLVFYIQQMKWVNSSHCCFDDSTTMSYLLLLLPLPGRIVIHRVCCVVGLFVNRRAPDPDPDPAGSEVGSGKYWPDLHNYDIKHQSILSFHQMTHDNTQLYTKTH